MKIPPDVKEHWRNLLGIVVGVAISATTFIAFHWQNELMMIRLMEDLFDFWWPWAIASPMVWWKARDWLLVLQGLGVFGGFSIALCSLWWWE